MKTRLGQNLPPSAVVDLYRCLLGDTLALAKSLDGVELAIMCPVPDVDDLALIAGEKVRVVAQTGEGLAAGLTSVFAQFGMAGRRRVIAFNSDSPHLPRTVLESAFDALASSLGLPTTVATISSGLQPLIQNFLSAVEWGTTSALEELLSRARALRLSVGFADTFYDIDVMADLSRLASELEMAADRAPRTAAWLKRCSLARGAAV